MAIEQTSAAAPSHAALPPTESTPSAAVEQLAGSLSPQIRACLIDLDTKARLWAREGNGLRRIGIVESLERWAAGRPVAIVTALQTARSQSSDSRSSYSNNYNLLDRVTNTSNSSSGHATTDVNYTFELVQNPKLLAFVRDGGGIDGIGEIPAQGGTVRVSTTYSWSDSSRSTYSFWLQGFGNGYGASSGMRVTT